MLRTGTEASDDWKQNIFSQENPWVLGWSRLTLRVAACLNEGVRPLAGAREGTEGEAGVAGNPIGRHQGADTRPGPGGDHGGKELQSLGLPSRLFVWGRARDQLELAELLQDIWVVSQIS